MSYNYLASPYTHADLKVMYDRYDAALTALGWLLKRKIWTYSPIAHCHNLSVSQDLPFTADYWAPFNRTMLKPASTLLVLEIDGWQTSKGVAQEIGWAKEERIPIGYLRANKARGYQIITSLAEGGFG